MIAIIGGSGADEIIEMADSIEKQTVDTEYGSVEVTLMSIGDKTVAFLPRHSEGHSVPPHKIIEKHWSNSDYCNKCCWIS